MQRPFYCSPTGSHNFCAWRLGSPYDAGLLTEFGTKFLSSGKAGVNVYPNQAGQYKATRLVGRAQAMANTLQRLKYEHKAYELQFP